MTQIFRKYFIYAIKRLFRTPNIKATRIFVSTVRYMSSDCGRENRNFKNSKQSNKKNSDKLLEQKMRGSKDSVKIWIMIF